MAKEPEQKLIALRAYRLWEDEGRPDGRHDEHWSAARAQLQEEDQDQEPVAGAAPAPAPRNAGSRNAAAQFQTLPGSARR